LEFIQNETEKMLNPKKLKDSDDDRRNDTDSESSGEENTTIKDLQQLVDLSLVFKEVTLVLPNNGKTAFIWNTKSDGQISRVQHDNQGKFTGPEKEVVKILSQVAQLCENVFINSLLSASQSKKVNSDNYLAYAAFWSDKYKRTDNIQFKDLEFYELESESSETFFRVSFLFNPANHEPDGIVMKPLKKDPMELDVRVFTFAQYGQEKEGESTFPLCSMGYEVLLEEFLGKRVCYVN